MTDKGGKPEVTIPESAPPQPPGAAADQGKGKKVGANDAITFNYLWVRWSDGKVLEETTAASRPPLSCLVCFQEWSRA